MRASEVPHQSLVSELGQALGDAAARELDQLAQINLLMYASGAGAVAAYAYAKSIERVASCTTADFAARYEASLRRTWDSQIRAQSARLDKGRRLLERAEAGEPLVSTADIVRVLESSVGAELLETIEAGLAQMPAADSGSAELAEDDLGRLLQARRRSRKPH